MDQPSNIAALRALSAEDLVAAYQSGSRDFSRSNLLRPELEAAAVGVRGLSCVDHPAARLYNALWVDFRFGIEKDFEWDVGGRCLSGDSNDLPALRNLVGVDLQRVNLAGSYLYPVDLSRANLTGSDLRRAVFIDCAFAGADLVRCDLRDARFECCDLRGADLYMARMDRMTMVECDARSANFERAKLYRARLNRVDLRGAKLRKGHCTLMNLLDSDIRDVDLSAVKLPFARVSGSRITSSQTSLLLAALELRVDDQLGSA